MYKKCFFVGLLKLSCDALCVIVTDIVNEIMSIIVAPSLLHIIMVSLFTIFHHWSSFMWLFDGLLTTLLSERNVNIQTTHRQFGNENFCKIRHVFQPSNRADEDECEEK